ncbi:MAG TPA: hypothetical protein VMN56_01415 [Casimicrobiaceae bacterium]|nr:hypothetical protein [Casimicrobiaceae bacterium]
MSYGKKTYTVVYGNGTDDYTEADWVRLALAALDQAGVSVQIFAEAERRARGDVAAMIAELDLDDEQKANDEGERT